MSINRSIFSNGFVNSMAASFNNGTSDISNGHLDSNGMATLAGPNGGDNTSRNSTSIESPKQESDAQQKSNRTSSHSPKPKTIVATPDRVMEVYKDKLTQYEHHEIIEYPQIYHIGAEAKKIHGIIGGPSNCGYDDEDGFYIHTPNDHIAYRYEIIKVVGKGSFGQVFKARDHKNQLNVALKIVRNDERFRKPALVEIKILDHLRKQDKENACNIIQMLDNFTFRSHTCITFELLWVNLYEAIKRNKFKGFSPRAVQKFGKSMLVCLDTLWRNKIIHCDLKPENVMLINRLEGFKIKVIDFGSSCYEHLTVYTYIQSRFYRAPEVILGAKYGLPIDMWSLACMLWELLTGYPLFSGEDEGDQLSCIIELLGMPPQRLINQSKRARKFISSKGYPRYCTVTTLPDGRTVLNGGRSRKGKPRGPPGSKELQTALKGKGCEDLFFLNFIRRCLEWEPSNRMTPNTALRHNWVTQQIPPRQPLEVAASPPGPLQTPNSMGVEASSTTISLRNSTKLPQFPNNQS